MAYELSNGHVIGDVTWPQRCCETVRSAILATAWLFVHSGLCCRSLPKFRSDLILELSALLLRLPWVKMRHASDPSLTRHLSNEDWSFWSLHWLVDVLVSDVHASASVMTYFHCFRALHTESNSSFLRHLWSYAYAFWSHSAFLSTLLVKSSRLSCRSVSYFYRPSTVYLRHYKSPTALTSLPQCYLWNQLPSSQGIK